MRPLHLADLDKRRPCVVLTRALVRPHLQWVTVAPITLRIRGLSSEVAVGPANGLDHPCVISCDNIQTIRVKELGPRIGYLLSAQEDQLAEALLAAFDLQAVLDRS